MVPGNQAEVEYVAPFGMVTITNENGTHSLPKEIAMSIHVKKI